ncbi:MAG: DMT family transporter [Rhodospirillaceae bacterium]|jgi:drug/metabolite transporter (DMT)-like permease|nr:DMT family transporter [Rhodospirillaceae bacterium]MBT4587965.1 DMT family transporter [Rhodospirillaceae bacterium]MBT5939264.1 DMT family transporter [Rhodospirillaceae bacterium]MBT7955314.1 DMT family transporter [Rhodospirillaceae bacterium]
MIDRSSPPSPFLRSAIWAVLAAVCFAVMVTSVHYMAGKFDAFEIVFFRAVLGLLMVIPMVSRSGVGALKTTKLPLHFVRTLFGLLAMATMYYAVAVKPVAEVIALTFLIPLFVTIAAGVVLREVVGLHRWAATLIGFAGAMVIIRPGIMPVDEPVLLVLLSSALYAGAWSCVKILTRTDAPGVTVFWMSLLMVPITAIPLLFVWVTPSWADVPALAIMAFSGWAAHYSQAQAFENSDASAVMPFDFLRLPLAAVFGYALFAELLDVWTWIGSVIIFAAGYYITRREALKKHGE